MSTNKLNQITIKYQSLPYMSHPQALYMRDIILENKFSKLCELGHYHGKSSIYLASILEEQGFGHLWTFDLIDSTINPTIDSLLKEFQLESFVTPIVTHEGFCWDLFDMKVKGTQTFDFCYIDGGHSFEITSMAFFLIDKMLDQNGIIIFDDYNWILNNTIKNGNTSILNAPMYKPMTERQRSVAQVKMACDIFVDKDRYELVNTDLNENSSWAIYRKKV